MAWHKIRHWKTCSIKHVLLLGEKDLRAPPAESPKHEWDTSGGKHILTHDANYLLETSIFVIVLSSARTTPKSMTLQVIIITANTNIIAISFTLWL